MVLKRWLQGGLLVCSLVLSSCIADEFDTEKGFEVSPRVVLPVLKAKSTLKDVSDIRDLTYNGTITGLDISTVAETKIPGFPPLKAGETIPNLPAIGPDEGLVVPEKPEIFSLSAVLRDLTVDTLEMEFIFTNSLPLTIAAGTELVFRNNQDEHNEEIFRQPLANDVAPGEEVSVPLTAYGEDLPLIQSKISFQMEKFSTREGTNVQVPSNPDINFTMNLNIVSIDQMTVLAEKSYDAASFSEFTFDRSVIGDNTEGAKLYVIVENRLPLELTMKLDMFEGINSGEIGSLLDSTVTIRAAQIDPKTGKVLQSKFPNGVDELNRIEIDLSDAKMDQLDRTKYVRSFLEISTVGLDAQGITNGNVVVLSQDASLAFKVIGDLQLDVNTN